MRHLPEQLGFEIERTLVESDRHGVYRLTVAEGPRLVGKVRPHGVAGAAVGVGSLRHELRVLTHLTGQSVVRPVQLSTAPGGDVLITEYWGQGALDITDRERWQPLAAARLLAAVARALEGLHTLGVIHGDLRPENILVGADGSEVRLCDLEHARFYRDAGGSLISPFGSATWIAPELTGRVARSPDPRSDLYSLGVVAFGLLSGRPPFETTDPLDLIHAHLAHTPPSLMERMPDMPAALAGIVRRLLEKSPADRYQTAAGLAMDLEACVSRLEAGRPLVGFRPGLFDPRRVIQTPAALYGREAERATLVEAFEQCQQQGVSLALISGGAGTGKTRLVEAVWRTVQSRAGMQISGAFELLGDARPFQVILDALGRCATHLLSQPDEAAPWVERLNRAVAPNGRLLTDGHPELANLLGPQPPLHEVGPTEAGFRMTRTLARFIEALGSVEGPVFLQLDNLHMADPAHLALLEVLAADGPEAPVMVLGTLREEGLSEIHPLTESMARIKALGVPVISQPLCPIPAERMMGLVQEALGVSAEEVEPAAFVVEQAKGNPLAALRLIEAWHRQGALVLEGGHWTLDELAARRAASAALGELSVQRLEALPQRTRVMMQLLAVMGTAPTIEVLAVAAGRSVEAVNAALAPARAAGLVRELAGLSLTHDSLIEAGLSALGSDGAAELRLEAARRLDAADLTGQAPLIAMLYNGARVCVEEPAERLRAATLNLICAQEALERADAARALQVARTGREALPGPPEDETARALAFGLCLVEGEAAWTTGDGDRALAVAKEADAFVAHDRERVELGRMRLKATYLSPERQVEGIDAGLKAVELTGVELLPIEAALTLEIPDLATMVALPHETDETILLGQRILVELIPPAFTRRPELIPCISGTLVHLGLTRGLSAMVCQGLCKHALVTIKSGAVARAAELAEMGLELMKRFDDPVIALNAEFVVGCFVYPWLDPPGRVANTLKLLVDRALVLGDVRFAAISAFGQATGLAADRTHLDRLEAVVAERMILMKRLGYDWIHGVAAVVRQWGLCLAGAGAGDGRLSGVWFDESDLQPEDNPARVYFCHLARAELRYHQDLIGEAVEAIEACYAIREVQAGSLMEAWLIWMSGLIHVEAARQMDTPGEISVARIEEAITLHRAWVVAAPSFFTVRLRALEAEHAWLKGDLPAAREGFERALEAATGSTSDEALIWTRMARLLQAMGRPATANGALERARGLYTRWGAHALADRLAVELGLRAPARRVASPVMEPGLARDAVDMASLTEGALALADGQNPWGLIGTLLTLVLRTAGATRVFLGQYDKGRLSLAGLATWYEEKPEVRAPAPEGTLWPEPLMNYVARMDRVVTSGEVPGIDTGSRPTPASTFCLPIRRRQQVVAVICLEHTDAPEAFRADLQRVIQVLGGQAAALFDVMALEEQVGRLTRRLEAERETRSATEARLARSENLKVIGQLAGSVAHDFNNFLTAVQGFLSLILEELELLEDADAAASLAELAEEAMTAARRSAALAARLLTFSRGEHLAPRPVDLNALAESMAQLLERLVDDRGTLTFELAPDLPPITADPTSLEQVLLNLVVNAQEAIETGGHIKVHTRAEAREVILEVTDDGCGMPPEVQAQALEPFFTTRAQGRGTGLGLSTVANITRGLGGRISILSEVGVGTTMRISLPAGQEADRAVVEADVMRAAPAAGLKVLVVEDEQQVRALMRVILERAGHEVLLAASVNESRPILKASRPLDLLVTDVMLPDGTGLDLWQMARALQPGLPVLLTSGYVNQAVALDTRELDATGWLSKPFSANELLNAISRVLDPGD